MILDRLFGRDDENLEAQRRDVDYSLEHILSVVPKGTLPALTSVDQLPEARGSFGYSVGNPIPVNGPVGESVYIFRLRSKSGQKFYYQRLGSTKHAELNRDIDVFELVSTDGRTWIVLYFSMLHARRSKRAPDGLSLASWRECAAPVGVLAKLGAFGETNHRSEGFPHCLPDHVRDNPQLRQTGVADALATKMEGLLRDISISPRPYDFAELCAQLHPPGLGQEEAALVSALGGLAEPGENLDSDQPPSSIVGLPESSASPVTNQAGRPAKIVLRPDDGMAVGAFMPLANIMSQYYLTQQEKETFARWARLPSNEWTVLHGERFALTLLHYIAEEKEGGGDVPANIRIVTADLRRDALPPLGTPLRDDVRDVFRRFLQNMIEPKG